MHPLLAASLINSVSTDRARAAKRAAAPRSPRPPRLLPSAGEVIIRRASATDAPALVRLAALDSDHHAGRLLAEAADEGVVIVAEVDGELQAARVMDDSVSVAEPVPPQRGAPAAARPARPPARRRRAAPQRLAPERAAPTHVVTSGRCCRPARPLPAPSRPGSGWRGRRRCCVVAPRATASRSRCAPRGPTRRWSSSPTRPRCARSSPPRSTSRPPAPARRSSSRSSGRARSSCSTGRRTCASASSCSRPSTATACARTAT